MDYALHVGVLLCHYVILASAFNLLLGLAGLFVLSLAAFSACGAYVSAILATQYGVPFPLTTLASIATAAVVGALTALPALRVGGHYLVIVTLALQVIVIDILLNGKPLTGGTDGISGIPPAALFGLELRGPAAFLPLSVVAAILCFWVARRIAASPAGRALRAMRENESAALSVGKDTVAMKLTVFATAAALAAFGGSLYAHYFAYISPHSFLVDETIYVLAMVVLGGIGNPWGALAGAALLVALPEALKFLDLPLTWADMIRNILYGMLLIVILRVRPEGLLPEARWLRGLARHAAPSSAAAQVVVGGNAHRPARGTLVGEGLVKRFGGVVAVDGVTLHLSPGQVTGLIGPNGAGKTTMFNLLTGFLKPTAGHVRYQDQVLDGLRPHQIVGAGVARSFQDLRLFRRMTVLENVMVALPGQIGEHLWAVFLRSGTVARDEARNAATARAILEQVGLGHKILESAEDLSYAEEKLLVVARLLATGADALLLDEPLAGLDAATLQRVMPSIRELAAGGRIVCIIEHNLDVIRGLCDTAAYLDEGRILAVDTPERLIADPELARRYFQ